MSSTTPLRTVRRATVTKITTLQCDACTNGWHLDGFPDWTRPAVVRCPWCGIQQFYPEEPRQHGADLCDDIEAEQELDMTESGLTTQREREAFTALVNEFLERDLPNAPRKQLQDIERFIRSWKPVADHRRVDGGLYGTHGSRHLWGEVG